MMQWYRCWPGYARLGLALAGLALLPAGLGAQTAGRDRPLLRVTPSMGWAIAGRIGNSGVTTGGLRAEVPLGARLAPWVSWSSFQLGIDCIPENPTCPSDGTLWLAGAILDGAGERTRIRPYLGAGIGQWRNDEGSAFTHSVFFGAAVELIPWLAPTAELRWGRYPVYGGQVVAAVGLQLAIPRPRPRASSGP